jgi:hypothetical protein
MGDGRWAELEGDGLNCEAGFSNLRQRQDIRSSGVQEIFFDEISGAPDLLISCLYPSDDGLPLSLQLWMPCCC